MIAPNGKQSNLTDSQFEVEKKNKINLYIDNITDSAFFKSSYGTFRYGYKYIDVIVNMVNKEYGYSKMKGKFAVISIGTEEIEGRSPNKKIFNTKDEAIFYIINKLTDEDNQYKKGGLVGNTYTEIMYRVILSTETTTDIYAQGTDLDDITSDYNSISPSDFDNPNSNFNKKELQSITKEYEFIGGYDFEAQDYIDNLDNTDFWILTNEDTNDIESESVADINKATDEMINEIREFIKEEYNIGGRYAEKYMTISVDDEDGYFITDLNIRTADHSQNTRNNDRNSFNLSFVIANLNATKNSFLPLGTEYYFDDNNDIEDIKEEIKEIIDDKIEKIMENQKKFNRGGGVKFNGANTSLALFQELSDKSFLFPKDTIYLWLYEGENAEQKLDNGEYDWVLYPFSSIGMMGQRGFIPPIKKIWTTKFQNKLKGADKLLGVIKAELINDGKGLFIDIMSVNPKRKKQGIMSYMIKYLRDTYNLSQEQIEFSDTTDDGRKFVSKKTYEQGGNINFKNNNMSKHKDGLFVGKSHKEGGIPMVVKSTGQRIEVEGGESITNKTSMADTKRRTLTGTNCEIISQINTQNGNGVAIDCDSVVGKKYEYKDGGMIYEPKFMHPTNSKMKSALKNDFNINFKQPNIYYPKQSLGLKRNEMPQIRKQFLPILFETLSSDGIKYEDSIVSANTLKPSQNEINIDLTKTMNEEALQRKTIIVSSDNYVIDGHHRWYYAFENNIPVKITKIDLPIEEALNYIRQLDFIEQDEIAKRGMLVNSQKSLFGDGGGVDVLKKDRYGNEVKIGDAIHIRVLTGKYGQTKDYEGIVTNFDKFGNVELDGQRSVRYTADYKHNDYEHGHHIWVEKINAKDIKENLRVPKKFTPTFSSRDKVYGEDVIFTGTEIELKEFLKNKYPNSVWGEWNPLFNKGWRYNNGKYISPDKQEYDAFDFYQSVEQGQGYLNMLMIPKKYADGGNIEVDKYSEQIPISIYEGVIGDFDNDGIANADDLEPNVPSKVKLEEISFKDELTDIIKYRNLFVDVQKKVLSKIRKINTCGKIQCEIKTRIKTPYSIINKLRRRSLTDVKTLDKLDKKAKEFLKNKDLKGIDLYKGLTDVLGFMVIVEDFNFLNKLKSEVEAGNLGEVLEFEDFYKNDLSGYRAYHFLLSTEVNGTFIPYELQLRTMRVNELAKITHTIYKQGKLNATLNNKIAKEIELADKGNKVIAKIIDKKLENKDLVTQLTIKKLAFGDIVASGFLSSYKYKIRNDANKLITSVTEYGDNEAEARKDLYRKYNNFTLLGISINDGDYVPINEYIENKKDRSQIDLFNTEQRFEYAREMKKGGVIYRDLSTIKPQLVMESEKSNSIEVDEVSIVKTGEKFVFNKRKISSSQDSYDLLKDFWNKNNINVVEEFNVILLDKQNKPISIYRHSKGGIDATIGDIEVISAVAVKTLAKGVIMYRIITHREI
jgi:ppGpp synthetase/RelA/SpoT-type nucleotidyltranferase